MGSYCPIGQEYSNLKDMERTLAMVETAEQCKRVRALKGGEGQWRGP